MITFTGHLYALYALAAVSCLIGFAAGICAVFGPGPASPPRPDPPRPPGPLPRAGRFTLLQDPPPPPPPAPPADLWDTAPLVLLSEHYALIDATGREAARLDAAWRGRYLS